MAEYDNYYYNHQMRRYLVQFMAIFADMNVQVGWQDDKEPRMIKVPIKNTSSDRIVADLFSENTQNKAVRLPLLAAGLTGIIQSPERRHGVGVVRREVYAPVGGLIPNDLTVLKVRAPVPYTASFDLSIWASNQDQHYQILEQILMIFNPILEIQTSDDVLDPSRITSVELMSIQMDEQPPGTERRVIKSTLSFDVVIYMSTPALKYDQVVRDIYVRVAAIARDTEFGSSDDTIAAIENTGAEYEHWFDSDDIDFPQT